MKDLILSSGLYQDVNALSTLIGSMEYENAPFGQEILNFQYIPVGLQEYFSQELFEDVEIQPNTGIFRKPNAMIHFENFYQHTSWVAIVALEDTVLTTHNQENVATFFDVADRLDTFISENCFDVSKWNVDNIIKLKKNTIAFIRPWFWYSLQENSLVQIFLLNHKTAE